MMTGRHTCEGRVSAQFTYIRGSPQCGKTAKICHEGKWYCGTHDPVRRANKRAEKEAAHIARWRERQDASTRGATLTTARNAVIEAARATVAIGAIKELVEAVRALDAIEKEDGA